MYVLFVFNWIVNFSSFYIDISLRKKREREWCRRGRLANGITRRDVVGFIVRFVERVFFFFFWIEGGGVLVSFRSFED